MSYATTAQTLVWLAVFGAVLAVDGVAVGSSVLMAWGAVIAAAAIVPARLIGRSIRRRSRPATTRVHRIASASRIETRPLLEVGGLDIYRWENEGGARHPTCTPA